MTYFPLRTNVMQLNLEASGMIDFFRMLPNLFSGGVYLSDPITAEVLFANDFFGSDFLFRKAGETNQESDFLAYLLPEDLNAFQEQFLANAKIQNKDKTLGDYRFLFPNTSAIRWFQFEKKKVNLPQISKTDLHLVFVREVTNEKVSEGNITEQIQFFLGLFENASVGMALQDWEGGYFRVNPRFTEITGYSIQNLTELNLRRIKGDTISKEEAEYFRFFKEGAEESHLTRKDGRRISVYRRVNAFRNAQGKPDFYYVFLDDVTEKKQIESYQIHSQKLETIGSLATNIAHDLNNYLQPIHVFSQLGEELIQAEKFDLNVLKNYFQKIRMGATNARNMIHRIIQYSKVKVGDQISSVEISSVLESSIPIFLAGLPKNVELYFDFYKHPLFTKVDAIKLSKILSELISGGILSWDDRKRGEVLVKTSALDDSKLLISIEFFGLSLPTISEYTTLDFVNFSDEEFQWTGLHLINRYVKNWHGEFLMERSDSCDLLIKIMLPLDLEKSETNESLLTQTNSKQGDIWSEIANKNIWIVDDDDAASEAIGFVLAQKNLKPTFFQSSQDALSALQKETPDFLLSDYRMRDLNGLDLIRKVKNHVPSLASVLYTGNLQGLDVERLESEGILIRSKPISIDELYETILLAFGFL
ncbi:PAS domain S-box protein [Leptospira sp. 96542]|nr:PAS domain S-box protein [Leptospira sp. 96542]